VFRIFQIVKSITVKPV